jgi:hypothetical protein
MAAFRRCVIALAVLAVFAGLASAQVMNCSVTSQQGNINLRSESKAELISDLLITCSSTSVNLQTLTPAPVVNFTVTFNAPVTSKILVGATGASPYNQSEALMLIDDPQNSPTAQVANFGTGATQGLCGFSATLFGCAAFPNIKGGVPVMSASAQAPDAPAAGAANIYQGISSGNSLTFFGVPVIPPGSTSTRTFRVTNVRVNASSASGQIFGSVSVQGGLGPGASGAGQLTFNQTVSPPLGTSTASLSVSASGTSLTNCNALTAAFAGTVKFTELFNNAFKQRVVAGTAQFSGQSNTTLQNIPGAFNGNTESDFVNQTLPVGGQTPGLADFGTRLKAVFSNIPSGARVFVSFTNVGSSNTTTGNAGSVNTTFFNTSAFQGPAGNSNTGSFAALLTPGFEATPDTSVAPTATPNTNVVNFQTNVPTAWGGFGAQYPYYELAVAGGSATAVWEVLNTNPSATETFTFAVFITQAAQAPTGTTAADITYAPTTTTSVVPNFVDPGTTTNVFTINQCRTLLLFPYVTSAAGFDTGLSIANTTADPLGTAAQTGTCTFNWYGAPTLAANTSPTIAAGTIYAFNLGGLQSGFSGYMIAVCNFQFAHGFAFVADWTSTIQSSAMGYLALVMTPTAPRLAVNTPGGSEGLVQ